MEDTYENYKTGHFLHVTDNCWWKYKKEQLKDKL